MPREDTLDVGGRIDDASLGSGLWPAVPEAIGDFMTGAAAAIVRYDAFDRAAALFCRRARIRTTHRACYAPVISFSSCLSMRQTKATMCRPANVLA